MQLVVEVQVQALVAEALVELLGVGLLQTQLALLVLVELVVHQATTHAMEMLLQVVVVMAVVVQGF
ncbi:MAG: hypothetical protein EBT28_12200 [Betaproteobacteria bacterium]|nr:hypothetical protein [Betaproteobacteria bacterium]